MILLYFTIALFLAYSFLLGYYRHGWFSVPRFNQLPAETVPDIQISVIIPARNEEKNIGRLLDSLRLQTYPDRLYEIIVVDDHSSDKTAAIAEAYPFVKLVSLTTDPINSYKKKAIEAGIAAAGGELIVTTDADCVVTPDWLKTLAAFYHEKKAVIIAAPVKISAGKNFLELFQLLDFMVLQGITAASLQLRLHPLCNGANLAYKRTVFYEVNGFAGIDHIASGDDMLLMQKIARCYPNQIFYLLSKNALVTTKAAVSWKAFLHQRIRWASKATHYQDPKTFLVLLLVYSFNLCLLLLGIAGWWNFWLWIALGGILIAKTFAELLFIYPVAKFFEDTRQLPLFFLFQPFHIVYTLVAGWLGIWGRYEWKGRKVK